MRLVGSVVRFGAFLWTACASPHRAPIHGGVDLGYIAATLSVGTPPRDFDVILDTGSQRTVLPCVRCNDCGHVRAYDATRSRTARATNRSFSMSYVEGSSLRGRFVEDVVVVGGVRARISVGCADVMTKLFRTQAADGIAGLDDDPTSLVQALRAQDHSNTFGLRLCPGARFFEVGGGTRGGVSAPFQKRRGNYYVQSTGVGVEHGARLAHAAAWIVDSGTTFLYVDQVLLKWVRHRLAKVVVPTLASTSGVGCVRRGAALPFLRLYWDDGQSLRLSPSQYTYRTIRGRLCVGVFDTGFGNENTLGLIALEERATWFDLSRDHIAFDDC